MECVAVWYSALQSDAGCCRERVAVCCRESECVCVRESRKRERAERERRYINKHVLYQGKYIDTSRVRTCAVSARTKAHA